LKTKKNQRYFAELVGVVQFQANFQILIWLVLLETSTVINQMILCNLLTYYLEMIVINIIYVKHLLDH